MSQILWETKDSCHYYVPKTTKTKLAIFDLDDTLMKLNTVELVENVVQYALECSKNNFYVAVISNQYGITKQKTTLEKVKERFAVLDALFNNNCAFIFSTEKDKYRKPMTGMYDLLLEKLYAPHTELDTASFYCGDAVGRVKDFAVSDYYFAQNCGLRCLSAPDLKLVTNVAYKWDFYKTLNPMDQWLATDERLPESSQPTLILTVGPPGAGKSTFARLLNYKIINRDTDKTKMDKIFMQELEKGTSIILDNTNYSKATRDKYIIPARRAKYRILIYYFDIPKGLSFHMCQMRLFQVGLRIPPVAIHTYYKRLEPPTSDEAEVCILKGLLGNVLLDASYWFRYDFRN